MRRKEPTVRCATRLPGWSAGKAEIDYWLRVAVPKLAGNRPAVVGARVSAGVAGGNAVAVPVEDIEGRAFTTFEAEQGAVLLKTLARGLAKYAATKQADKKGKGAGWLANLVGAAFETADTRSWLTLPNRIAMARLRLPGGVHDLQVELTDADGRTVATETIAGVTVRSDDTAGGMRLAQSRIIPSDPTRMRLLCLPMHSATN